MLSFVFADDVIRINVSDLLLAVGVAIPIASMIFMGRANANRKERKYAR